MKLTIFQKRSGKNVPWRPGMRFSSMASNTATRLSIVDHNRLVSEPSVCLNNFERCACEPQYRGEVNWMQREGVSGLVEALKKRQFALKASEVADLFQVSPMTIYRAAKDGSLP